MGSHAGFCWKRTSNCVGSTGALSRALPRVECVFVALPTLASFFSTYACYFREMACGTIMVACVLEEAEEQGRVALGKYMGLSRVNRGGSMCFLQIIGVVCLRIGLSVVGRRGSTVGRHMYEAVKFCLLHITRGGGGGGGCFIGADRVAGLGALEGAAQKERAEDPLPGIAYGIFGTTCSFHYAYVPATSIASWLRGVYMSRETLCVIQHHPITQFKNAVSGIAQVDRVFFRAIITKVHLSVTSTNKACMLTTCKLSFFWVGGATG